MEKNRVIWNLVNRMRGRIPENQVVHLIVSFAYDYCNEHSLIGGNSTELLNIADEMIKRIPTDVIFDLKELFDSMSVNQIVHFIISLVQIGDRFTYLSSETMSKLVLELLDLKEEDIVFDLGSGNGGFLGKILCYAKENHIKLDRVFGVDIDNNHVSTSNMALEILTSETKGNFDVKYSNILTDDVSFKYTKGYVFPPFNIKIFGMDSKFDTIFDNIKLTPRNNSELVFIDRLLNNINGKNPRAVALVSGRMLFNNADKEYREALINEGLLEGIIELPNNILENTAIKTFLLIFSKNNQEVKMLDASTINVEVKNIFGVPSFDYESIVKLYKNEHVQTKTVKELLGLQNWMPSIALLDLRKPKNGVKLLEVAEIFTGSQYTIRNFKDKITTSNSEYKIITSSAIQDGLIDWLNVQSIDNDDHKLDKYALKTNDLIITSKSSKVKMAVVDIKLEEKFIVTGGMIVVRPKIEKLNPTYLKIYLESEQGQNIIKSVQKGVTIVTLNAKDLSKVLIPIPDIQYQFRMAQKYNNKLSSLLAYKNEITKIENDLRNFYYEEMHEVNE